MDAFQIQRVIDEFQPLVVAEPQTLSDEDVEREARRVWPEGELPIEKAGLFSELFCDAIPNNRTSLYFKPQITVEGGVVHVGGATNVATMRATMVRALRAAGIADVRGGMRLLPEEGRLDGELFGVCAAEAELTYDRPSVEAGRQTQLTHGEPVFLLDYDATVDMYLLHAADGYWGWARAEAIRVVSSVEFREQVELWGGAAGTAADSKKAAAIGVEVVERALELLHMPYVFGGVSPTGLDCSGFVRWVWECAGVSLARDAAQQFPTGRMVATRWHREGIRAGDLLFFADTCGRIYHVTIALDETHYVHAAAPAVRINSLKAGDRLYDARRAEAFFAAKRPMHNS